MRMNNEHFQVSRISRNQLNKKQKVVLKHKATFFRSSHWGRAWATHELMKNLIQRAKTMRPN